MIKDIDKWYDSNIFKRKDSYLLTLTYLTCCYWFLLKIAMLISIAINILQVKKEVFCISYGAFFILPHIQNLIRRGTYFLHSPPPFWIFSLEQCSR